MIINLERIPDLRWPTPQISILIRPKGFLSSYYFTPYLTGSCPRPLTAYSVPESIHPFLLRTYFDISVFDIGDLHDVTPLLMVLVVQTASALQYSPSPAARDRPGRPSQAISTQRPASLPSSIFASSFNNRQYHNNTTPSSFTDIPPSTVHRRRIAPPCRVSRHRRSMPSRAASLQRPAPSHLVTTTKKTPDLPRLRALLSLPSTKNPTSFTAPMTHSPPSASQTSKTCKSPTMKSVYPRSTACPTRS